MQRLRLARKKLPDLKTACERPRVRVLGYCQAFVIGCAKVGCTRAQGESNYMLVRFAIRTHICALQ